MKHPVLKVFNMDQSKLQWEEEVYHELKFKRDLKDPQIFTFEGENSMALLYFADRSEGNEFQEAISRRLQQLIDTQNRKTTRQPAHQPTSIISHII